MPGVARISREGKEDLHFARIKVQTSRQGAVVGPKWGGKIRERSFVLDVI